jgi:hypothetical protein
VRAVRHLMREKDKNCRAARQQMDAKNVLSIFFH